MALCNHWGAIALVTGATFSMTDSEVARLIGSIHRAVESRFDGITDNFQFGTVQRFRVTNPGRSKILDISDHILAIHKTVINIDDVLARDGVFAAMETSTNKQRVLWSTDGVSTHEL
jgi:hypothetical protein